MAWFCSGYKLSVLSRYGTVTILLFMGRGSTHNPSNWIRKWELTVIVIVITKINYTINIDFFCYSVIGSLAYW